MCESRDEKFVVPQRPGAGMGWWIGQLAGKSTGVAGLRVINLLWVQNPDCRHLQTIRAGNLMEFDSDHDARNYLASRGVKGVAIG